jgi:hypothetical protein
LWGEKITEDITSKASQKIHHDQANVQIVCVMELEIPFFASLPNLPFERKTSLQFCADRRANSFFEYSIEAGIPRSGNGSVHN